MKEITTRAAVEQAYWNWQSEESRDRGWDGTRCARLRLDYINIKNQYEKDNNTIFGWE